MYCRNCGRQLPDEAKFCPECGTEVPDLAALLQQQAAPEDGAETMIFTPAEQAQLEQAEQTATVYNADLPAGAESRKAEPMSARAYDPAQDEPVSPRAYVPDMAEREDGPNRKVLIAAVAAAAAVLVILSAVLTVKVLNSRQRAELPATEQAQLAYEEGRYNTARTLLEDYLADGTGTADDYKLLAQCLEALDDPVGAAQAYADGYAATGASSLANSAVDLWLTLAAQSDDGTAYYQKVLTLDPDNAAALRALQSAQDTETEAAPEETFPTVDPDEEGETETAETTETQSEQAQAFYDAGDYNGAEVILYTMRRSGSLTAEDYDLYGRVLEAQDREDGAVTLYYEGYVETGEESLRSAGTSLAMELADKAMAKSDYEVAQLWYQKILDYDSGNTAAADGLTAAETALNPPEPVYETVYTVVTGNYTWEEAKAEAEARGGQLAVITDQDDYDAIVQALGQTLLSAVWLGAETDTPGQWDDASWLDGTAITYTHWYPGEPNGEDGEQYLGLFLVDGTWYYNDFPNDISSYYENIGFVLQEQREVVE
jgi:tetratricopeptide (TPR) repeat protein